VGIYVGKLRFVNAPSTGGTVRLDYLTNPYWAKHFDGIRRLAPAKRAPAPFDAPTYEAATPAQRAPVVAAAAPALTPAIAPAAANAYATTTAPAPIAQNRLPSVAQPAYANSTATADAFEPPPSAMSAAQTQARNAGAVATTATAASADAPRDAIDAAADAFEPPPPAFSAAQRQAAQASQATTPSPGSPTARSERRCKPRRSLLCLAGRPTSGHGGFPHPVGLLWFWCRFHFSIPGAARQRWISDSVTRWCW
jgi:hypothetical protein